VPLTPEQFEARRRGIGGSDAPAVVGGIDTYRNHTAVDVYIAKVLGTVRETTPVMLRGHRAEPLIREIAADELGVRIDVPTETLVHPEHPWMLANLDGLTNDGGLFEAKSIDWRKARDELGEEGTDFVLPSHFIQVQHYMEVADLPFAHVVYFVSLDDVRYYVVYRDREIGEVLVDREGRFWRDHVEAQVPPAPVDVGAALRLTHAFYPRDTGEVLRAPAGSTAEAALLELRDARRARKAAAEVEKLARARVEALMGTARRIECDFGGVTWSNSSRTAWAAVAKEAGIPKALIQKHTKPGRRFLPSFTGDEADASEE
jgi:putative phage-type endonuclease